MKTINKLFLTIGAVATFGLASCTSDLDLKPSNPQEETDLTGKLYEDFANVQLQFTSPGVNGNSAVSGFDPGMGTFQRAIFNLETISTDEANWLSTDNDFLQAEVQYGFAAPSNAAVLGTYSRMTCNIAMCNLFIKNVQEDKYGLTSVDQQRDAQTFVKQAKILRGACYYYLIDLYGNIGYADENTPQGEAPEQLTRAEAYNRAVADLEAVVAEYGNDYTQTWAYVGKEVGMAILMKFYLNAEIYTGTPQWEKCWNICQQIIAQHTGTGLEGSGLVDSYEKLFAANNSQYVKGAGGAVSEIIWGLPQDPDHIKAWSGSSFMLNAFLNSKSDKAKWNSGGSWGCMTARKQLADKFTWTWAKEVDPATGEEKDVYVSDDLRTKWWATESDGFTYDANPIYNLDHQLTCGYLPLKYIGWDIDNFGNKIKPSSGTTECLSSDYAMIRLAEVYLSAAEADLRGSLGHNTESLKYVNYIRKRAGVSTWGAEDLTLQNLMDERQRELYTECTRRTDLIRDGKWLKGYNWTWKNQVLEGANLPDRSLLWPIPGTMLDVAGYTQNPGY